MMNKCIDCGGELSWECDYTFGDFDKDEEGVVTSYSCKNCDIALDVYRPIKNDKTD